MGITIFVSLQNDKGTISALNDHFAIKGTEFQDKHLFSPLES